MEKSVSKVNCIAVDDDNLSLNLISESVKNTPFLNLVGSFTNPYDAVNFINRNKVDLIFTDIEMPGITGIQLINCLKNKPMVVFISETDRYAINGFDLDVLDYLIKPYSFDRFLKASNKALNEFYKVAQSENEPRSISDQKCRNNIFVKSDYKVIKIPVSNILYIEGFNDYVKFFIEDSLNPVLSLMSLKELEENLPKKEFMRVHRSYIVSVNKISSIEKKRILIGKRNIPISNSYYNLFFDNIEKSNYYF
jgi:DNA-binding LytR/AlgR family response regulator